MSWLIISISSLDRTATIAWEGEFQVQEGVDGEETAAGISGGVYRVCVDGLLSLLSPAHDTASATAEL